MYFHGFTLVGRGQKKSDSCGKYIGARVYTKDKSIKHRHISCQDPNCPVCFPDWIDRVAGRSIDRIYDLEDCLRPNTTTMISHASASVKEDHPLYNDIEKLRKELKQILKVYGIFSCQSIAHHVRLIDRSKGYIDGNVRYSPHFHFLSTRLVKTKRELKWELVNCKIAKQELKDLLKYKVYSCDGINKIKTKITKFTKRINLINKALKWNITKHGIRKDRKGQPSKDAVIQTLKYELSHACTTGRKGYKIIRNFGDWSRAQKNEIKSEEWEYQDYTTLIGDEDLFGIPSFVADEVLKDKSPIILEEGHFGPNWIKDDGLLRLYPKGTGGIEIRKQYKYIPILSKKRSRYFKKSLIVVI
jgi:hypothetical protein